MNNKYIIKYFLLIIISFNLSAQEYEEDTVKYTHHKTYGIRLGMDLYRPIDSYLEKDKTAYEFSIDGRVWKNLFVPVEFGYEKNTIDFFSYNLNVEGYYIKTGVDYSFMSSLYKRNDIFSIGFRLATSNYSVEISDYIIRDNYWKDNLQGSFGKQDVTSYFGEIVLSLKAELLANIFIGMGLRYNIYLGGDKYNTMDAVYIPGFEEVFTGRNFQLYYGIYYFIPISTEK